jgi:LacI family transcriptional regulator
MRKRAKIALLIDTATTWGAGLIEGVADFAHRRGDWQLFLGPRGKYDRLLLPDHWDGDGVIARVTHAGLAQQLIERGIPAVNVSWYSYGGDAIAQCTCDEQSIAEMAVEYFLGRGFRQFAYCASSLRPDYTDRFGGAFVETLRRRSFGCLVFQPQGHPDSFLPSPGEADRMAAWLQALPRPTALLAFDCLQAREVTDVCHQVGIDVPHEIAVLGGEHDLLSSTISQPELSSIDHGPRRVGRTAAELLARLLAGEPKPGAPIRLPGSRVISRQSTDTIALSDDMLASAVRYIKEHSHERIQVNDVLRQVPISRRALEKGFRKCLRRSPAEEIRRARIDHAVQLLCDTSWAMPRIAAACGFDRPELMTRAFRRELKVTPSEFRRQHARDRQSLQLFGGGRSDG